MGALVTRAIINGGGAGPTGGLWMLWFSSFFLLIGGVVALVGSLAVVALVNLYQLRDNRWWLLAARILSGVMVAFAAGTVGLLVGLLLLPGAFALALGCVTRPAGDPAVAALWQPAG